MSVQARVYDYFSLRAVVVVLLPASLVQVISMATFEKWQGNFEHNHWTLIWLKCERDKCDCNSVKLLWCSACREYEGRICSIKNYSAAWRTKRSEIKRRAMFLIMLPVEKHKLAMKLLHTAQAKASNLPVTIYAPIVRALMTLEEPKQAKMRHKFDIYVLFLVKQGLLLRSL